MGTALVHNSSFYATTIAAGLLMVRLGSIMRHIELTDAHMSSRRADTHAASQHRTNRPSPIQPMAHLDPEPQHSPVSDVDKMVARERREELSQSITGEDVSRLAEALRAAKQAHSASLAELCQADADPVEDWPVWYAEYLLEVR